MRVSILSYKMPEVSGPRDGVFSKVPRHESTHDKRYFATTYYDSYQKRFDLAKFQPKNSKLLMTEKISAGNETGFKTADKILITTKLISEKYNTGRDPKYNTSIQRTWINQKDAGIKAVEELKIDNTQKLVLPKVVNELSIKIDNDKELFTSRSKSLAGCPKRPSDISKTTVKVGNLRRY